MHNSFLCTCECMFGCVLIPASKLLYYALSWSNNNFSEFSICSCFMLIYRSSALSNTLTQPLEYVNISLPCNSELLCKTVELHGKYMVFHFALKGMKLYLLHIWSELNLFNFFLHLSVITFAGKSLWSWCKESQNFRMVRVGSDVRRSSCPTPVTRQSYLDPVTQKHI